MTADPVIRNISDTAAWVAVYRAMETERSDAVFRDPFARRLAGKRGEDIMTNVAWARRHAWSYTARTYAFDWFIEQEVRSGTVNRARELHLPLRQIAFRILLQLLPEN